MFKASQNAYAQDQCTYDGRMDKLVKTEEMIPDRLAPARKLADKLYEILLSEIIDGQFKEADKLPSEAELGQRYSVSRPVVREALSRLHADGIVFSRRGSGTYIRRRPQKELFKFAPLGGLADVMRCFEYRIGLEAEAAGLAAARRTDKDLKRMQDALEELRTASSNGLLGIEADLNFHNAVITATKNHLFQSTMDALANVTRSGISITRALSLRASTERLHLVQQEHVAVCTAIADQDVEAARSAMRVHISNARIRLMGDSD